jgi:hypothetical protein
VSSQVQIIAAVKNIDAPMLTRLWQELEYRIDVSRVTVVHTSKLSICKNTCSVFLWL